MEGTDGVWDRSEYERERLEIDFIIGQNLNVYYSGYLKWLDSGMEQEPVVLLIDMMNTLSFG